jgi:subtilisin family serine protease
MNTSVPRDRGLRFVLAAAASVVAFTAANAAPGSQRGQGQPQVGTYRAPVEALQRLDALRLPQQINRSFDVSAFRKVDPALLNEGGTVEVLVRLKDEPAALADIRQPGSGPAAKSRLMADQETFIGKGRKQAKSLKVTGRAQVAINAVFVEVDSSQILKLAEMPEVERISMVKHYEMDLSETVPQIGAAAVQAAGLDGSGVKVAVLDSGIDYTHVALGGAGTLEAYEAAYGTVIDAVNTPENTSRDGLFPTAKVVEGFDFVGEEWPFGPRTEDDDPIPSSDLITFGGHGTHVADIIGGITPGTPGVAPGVDFYAVKVCAAYSSSCNGVALIKGVEYSLDPNGDGDISDRVDIMNMSLGANFGQAFDDDLAYAVDIASAAGILTVASAGNGGDLPFITGTPAAAPSALSVAQTAVASQVNSPAMEIVEPAAAAGLYAAVFQAWSAPLTSTIEAPVAYGDGVNLLGCNPFGADLSGAIVLVNRGACTFTQKIANIQDAGGIAGIIGLVDGSAPFPGGDGGVRPSSGEFEIPGYMISLADADLIRGGDAIVRFDPNAFYTNYPAKIVASSSRGPGYSDNALKPEIGAPGASVSASSSTGEGVRGFGGTSGAAPMVAGAAALLLQAYPNRSPAEIKAVLMNTAETAVHRDVTGELEPISRIGGGEVRVDRALSSPVAAWDMSNLKGGISFGQVEVSSTQMVLEKTILVRNYSDRKVKYEPTPTFRYADDANTGAVSVQVIPKRVLIQPGKARRVKVRMTIDGSLLPPNFMNDGAGGGDSTNLTFNEFDGYLVFNPVNPSANAQPIAMPWHILPRQAAEVSATRNTLNFGRGVVDSIGLTNQGAGIAQNDAYSLLHLSDTPPPTGDRGQGFPNPDLRAFGTQTFLVPPGFCGPNEGYIAAFGYNYWERQALSIWPGQAGIVLDVNGDGAFDYDVFNIPLNYLGLTGDWRNVTFAVDLSTGAGTAFFLTEHATNTANQVLYVCDTQIGSPALSAPVPGLAYVADVYFGSSFNAAPVTWVPYGERFYAFDLEDIGPGQSYAMGVVDFKALGVPAEELNPGELGLMVFTNGDRGPGARGGATQATEALIFVGPTH